MWCAMRCARVLCELVCIEQCATVAFGSDAVGCGVVWCGYLVDSVLFALLALAERSALLGDVHHGFYESAMCVCAQVCTYMRVHWCDRDGREGAHKV